MVFWSPTRNCWCGLQSDLNWYPHMRTMVLYIYLQNWMILFGQMLVNIPYMEHMGSGFYHQIYHQWDYDEIVMTKFYLANSYCKWRHIPLYHNLVHLIFVSENKVPPRLHFGVCCSLGRLQEMHENLLFQVEHSLTMTSMFQKGERKKLACWWFGTFGLFFHSVGNVVTPTDVQSMIFQRGR